MRKAACILAKLTLRRSQILSFSPLLFLDGITSTHELCLTYPTSMLCFGEILYPVYPMALDLHTIQRAAAAGRITWRYHALLRARERGITRDQAIQVLSEGEIIEQRPRAKPYPKCLMMRHREGNQPLYVAVGYDHTDDRLYIITIHWLDPRKWEDPWRRRRKQP
jgi:hypothetical protein